MEPDRCFIHDEEESFVTTLKPFSHVNSLPFPLKTDLTTKLILWGFLICNFKIGFVLRLKIFKYIKSVDLKENPINYFMWNDQMNGIFLGLNILYTSTVLFLPFPLSNFIGVEACNWADIIGAIYVAGQTVWSCFMAIYRVVFIKCPRFVKTIGNSNFVVALTTCGYGIILSFAAFFSYHDKGILYKMCTQYSAEEVMIMNVIIVIYQFKNQFILKRFLLSLVSRFFKFIVAFSRRCDYNDCNLNYSIYY
jgi:hypothetical protein